MAALCGIFVDMSLSVLGDSRGLCGAVYVVRGVQMNTPDDWILMEAYRRMLTIRIAEETIAKDFLENKIFSFYHSSAGQEAVAVGVCMALTDSDRVFSNHRNHGHYIAKGGDLYRLLCEIYGKADGCCKGRGGSMHSLDRSVGFMGTTPILGSIVPIATGSAFEQKHNQSRNITVVFFGDGASEEGVVYESINIAAVMHLPIIYVIENNLYAVNTPHHVRRSNHFDRGSVYRGLGANYFEADGNDFLDTFDTAKLAVKVAQSTPVVLHLTAYRHMAHSGPIMDESVRGVDTKDKRQEVDPILSMEKLIPEDLAFRTRCEIRLVVAQCWQRAKACPEPEPSEAAEGVYV